MKFGFVKVAAAIPAVKVADCKFNAQQTETQIMRSMIDARLEAGMTQKQLSEKTGINQSNLSRIERGTGNPSVATLERIASALGKKVSISFV